MLRRLVEKYISRSKEQNYVIDNKLRDKELLSIIIRRLIMSLRGATKKPFLKKASGKLFLGRKVKILFGKMVAVGKNVTIEDGCFINALSKDGIVLGDNFKLGRNSIIECTGVMNQIGEGFVVGKNVGISANAYISVRGSVFIGDNTIIGPGISIQAENHNFDGRNVPIRLQGTNRKGITIKDNCWIGANVIILDGVTIGSGSVVAAGAVVTKDVDPDSVVGGCPARLIKKR